MFTLITRLQQKSMAERRRIAFAAAFFITAVIALMWAVWLMSGGIAGRSGQEEAPPAVTPAEGVWLPFKRAVGSFFESLKD
jgi:hypothetical protein